MADRSVSCQDCSCVVHVPAVGRPPKRCQRCSGVRRRTKTCGCGVRIGRKTKNCSACRRTETVARRQKRDTCGCGNRKSYGAETCRNCRLANDRRNAKVRSGVCAHCESQFQRPMRKIRDSGKYCSRECSFAFRKTRSSLKQQCESQRIQALRLQRENRRQKLRADCLRTCETCGKRFQATTPTARFCNPLCFRWTRQDRSCTSCGAIFSATSRQKSCKRCKRTVANRSLRKRQRRLYGRKHRERAKRRGLVYDPKVSSVDIFERDGWRCQSCGCETPKELQGNFAAMQAPTLDHIIPMSKGGSHTWSNLQLLCRRCNSLKGDKLDEEIKLKPAGGLERLPLFDLPTDRKSVV